MKFLVDANLPPRLCVWLKSRRHEAEHLFDLNLLTATDTQIWQHGRAGYLVIFTKDVDFYECALILGAPPQVVHVAVGNCSNSRPFDLLTSQWDDIELALESGSRLISVSLEKIESVSLTDSPDSDAWSVKSRVRARDINAAQVSNVQSLRTP